MPVFLSQRFHPLHLALAALLAAPLLHAQEDRSAACARLAELKLPSTAIHSSTVTPEGSFKPPAGPGLTNLPGFCRVTGTIEPAIKFEVWLPMKDWNGSFQGVGNGGMAGVISYRAMATALRRGYATASTDTGHSGDSSDASWAQNRPDLVADFGYRGLHLTTVAAKQIVDAFYKAEPKHAFFVGCSKGGGQALMEAQRFPDDYDGIVAGDPAYNPTALFAGAHLWYAIATLRDPESYIPASKVPTLTEAVNAACGARDGVIDDPQTCKYDPGALECKPGGEAAQCLTAKQVAAVRAIWGGLKDASGKTIFPGLLPGGESGSGGWARWVLGNAPFKGTHWLYADSFFKFMVFNDPHFDTLHSDAVKDYAAAREKLGGVLDAVNPDLRPFQKRGGKLILYHGLSDPDISALNSIHYYNDVVQTVGSATPSFFRLFLIPGMQHCSGGPGLSHFDEVTSLEEWVNEGKAPASLTASHMTDNTIDRTRPICPYPEMPVYNGQGSKDDTGSYTCKAPRAVSR